MTDDELMTEMMNRSDRMANAIGTALNDMDHQDHSYSVAVLTFQRMAAYAALCLGVSRQQFETSAGYLFEKTKEAMEAGEFVPPVKH
jgi:hypothetical protein